MLSVISFWEKCPFPSGARRAATGPCLIDFRFPICRSLLSWGQGTLFSLILVSYLQVQPASPWALAGLGNLRFLLGDEDMERNGKSLLLALFCSRKARTIRAFQGLQNET